jgi:hypothetical protein
MPDALIVPVAELPPVTPFNCQVTAVFDVPDTVALKDCVAPARTLALAGDTFTVMPDPDGGVLELDPEELVVVPVHPPSTAAAKRNSEASEYRNASVFELFINWRA